MEMTRGVGRFRKVGQLIGASPSLSLPLLFYFPPSFSSPPYPFPLLEVGPLSQLEGLGSAVSSPIGIWGRAPAANEFGAV